MNFDNYFHTAMVVADLDDAMAEFTRTMNFNWATPWGPDLQYRTPAGTGSIGSRCTVSLNLPCMELIQGRLGTLWSAESGGASRLHHIGIWVDDLSSESQDLTDRGMPLEASGVGPGGEAPFMWAYHLSPLGLRVEICDAALRPEFERAVSTGELGSNLTDDFEQRTPATPAADAAPRSGSTPGKPRSSARPDMACLIELMAHRVTAGPEFGAELVIQLPVAYYETSFSVASA